MSVGSIARQERDELCELMLDLGSDAPTLNEGWNVLDLAAHLVTREHDLWATPGLVLGGPFPLLLERAMGRRRNQGLPALVQELREGPPAVWKLVPPGAHLNEYFLHHEDVRRANGRPPRSDRDRDEALAKLVRVSARMLLENVKAGVDLVWNGGVLYRHGQPPRAVISGPPGEMLLYLSGRRAAAEVEIGGDSGAVDHLAAADLSL